MASFILEAGKERLANVCFHQIKHIYQTIQRTLHFKRNQGTEVYGFF